MNFEPKKRFILKLKDKDAQTFVIPEYQRPYRWGIDECETLWDDMLNVYEEKIKEYFLGSIVSYTNEYDNLEIIDGQQRITTLTLLYRALYACLISENESEQKIGYINECASFIWKKDKGTGKTKFNEPFLDSKVIKTDDALVLAEILKEHIDMKVIQKSKSLYAQNYQYFYDKIDEFKRTNSLSFAEFCDTILGDRLFVLFVTCDSQDSAMTIFNTLNSRGKPLSNADILKGRIYKSLKDDNKKSEFAKMWQKIASKYEKTEKDDMSVLFIQAMHVIRALNNCQDTTTPGLLDFFTKKKEGKNGNFAANEEWLEREEKIYELMDFIKILACFWDEPDLYLSDRAYRYYCVLNLFQNDMWKAFVTFLIWRNKGKFNEKKFNDDFSKEFDEYLPVLLKAITIEVLNNNASINIIKFLIFKMNADLNQGKKTELKAPAKEQVFMDNFSSDDKNYRPETRKVKFILYLYAHLYDNFNSDISNEKLEVEHILPRTWQNVDFDGWDEKAHDEYVEQIGNKILLPKKTNIKCANDLFSRKKDLYQAAENSKEVRDLGLKHNSWTKDDIKQRNTNIYEKLKNFCIE